MNGKNDLTVSMTSVVLHPGLAGLQAGNPRVFEKLMNRFLHLPQEGVIMVYVTGGKLSHLRTEVMER